MAVYKLSGGAGSIILPDERGDAVRVLAPNSILTVGLPEHIAMLDMICRSGAAEKISVEQIPEKADKPDMSNILTSGKIRV